jgi:hypothetical protein
MMRCWVRLTAIDRHIGLTFSATDAYGLALPLEGVILRAARMSQRRLVQERSVFWSFPVTMIRDWIFMGFSSGKIVQVTTSR